MSSPFSADPYVILPHEEAWVERLAGGDWLIRWRQPAGHVAVYASDDPDLTTGGWPLTVERAANNELRVPNLAIDAAVGGPSSAVRPYFLLELDGHRHIIAERTLPLTGESNFRDVGGYRTADGHTVRWGRVYRAGSLAELTEADVAYLGRLGLRLSCDLRSPAEMENHPDRLPPGAVARSTPIAAEVGRLRRLVTLFRLRPHARARRSPAAAHRRLGPRHARRARRRHRRRGRHLAARPHPPRLPRPLPRRPRPRPRPRHR